MEAHTSKKSAGKCSRRYSDLDDEAPEVIEIEDGNDSTADSSDPSKNEGNMNEPGTVSMI